MRGVPAIGFYKQRLGLILSAPAVPHWVSLSTCRDVGHVLSSQRGATMLSTSPARVL